MKTKEYVDKYKLNQTNHFNHKEFISDFTFDFLSLIKFHKNSKIWNYNKFKNCVTEIKQKFNSISCKTINNGLPEKLWNYFYATVVVKTKDELFGDYFKQKENEWKQKNAWKLYEEEEMHKEWSSFMNSILASLFVNTAPVSSFTLLGIEDFNNANEMIVKEQYRIHAKKAHPDAGGLSEEFIKITEAKNRCLAYLNNKMKN